MIVPFEWHESTSSITSDRIKALNSSEAISRQLLLEAYRPVNDEMGFYQLITGRIGIGFKISPPFLANDDILSGIKSAINSIDVKDVAVQIISFASTDISDYLDNIKESCACDTDVGNAQGLLKMRDDRISKTKLWSKKTMLSEASGADFRARNFINIFLVLFPEGTPESKLKSFYYGVSGNIKELNPEPLDPRTVAKIYGEILKEDASLSDYDIHKRMNTQLAKGASIKINPDDGLIKIGKKTYAKVLTTQKWVRHTTLANMTNVFFPIEAGEFQIPLPSPFFVSLTIHIENPEKVKKKILGRARANVANSEKINSKTSALFPRVKDTIEESRQIIDYLEKYEQKPFQAMYTITVFEESKDRLDTAIGRLKARAENAQFGGWKLKEEDMGIIALQTLLWSLPFQFDIETKEHLQRFDLMFNSNILAIAPLISSFKGIGSPILRFFARTGQVVGIDFWASQNNYNVCVIGPSGTGKSFLSNSIQSSHLQAGTKITIFDKGRSYLPLCQELKGEFICFEALSEDGKPNKKCLNFFTNLVTKSVARDEIRSDKILLNYVSFSVDEILGIDGKIEMIDEDFFQPLLIIVGIMCGQDFTPGIYGEAGTIDNSNKAVLKNILSEAIKVAFYRRGHEAGMREVGEALETFKQEAENKHEDEILKKINDLLMSLSAYIYPGGEFFDYFNGTCNINIKSDFCLVELDELTRKGDLYSLVIMFMLEMCIVDMYFDRSKRKSIVIDEAALMLRDAVTSGYLEDFARRVRKYNGSLMTITQEADDYCANKSSKAIWTNASHKFILSLDPATIERGFSDDGLFMGWSDFVKRQMLTVKNRVPEYSEVLYNYAGRFSEVLLLKATFQEGAMFTTNANEVQQKKELQKKYGLIPQEATAMFGYLKEGLKVGEILHILSQGDRTSNTEYWLAKIRNAINNNTITPFFQIVVDKEGKVAFYESLLRIIDDDEIFLPKDFLEVALAQDLLEVISRIHLQKCALALNQSEINFSINLHKDQIRMHLLDTLNQIMGDDKDFLILEIPSRSINEEDVLDFCLEAKKEGYKIALDNVKFDIDLGLLDEISPHLIKIDGELILSAMKDEGKKRRMKVLINLSKALDIKISASHIEDERILKAMKELDVDFFQGNFIAEPSPIFKYGNIKQEEAS